MAIFLNDNIECRKSEPLDTRIRVANAAALIALNPLYNYVGMLVITLDTLGVYQLTVNDGTTASDWALKSFITTAQASDIVANTAKVGITPTQSSDITTNTAKISFDSASSTRLANTSGTNTGDQDLSNLVDLTTNQSIGGDKTFTGSTVAGSIAAFRPVINKTASFIISATELNKGCKLDITTAVVISVDASSDTAFPIGGEIEFYWYSDSGANTITMAASGGQTIVSADAALKLSKVGSCAVLKKVSNSYWILTGDLS